MLSPEKKSGSEDDETLGESKVNPEAFEVRSRELDEEEERINEEAERLESDIRELASEMSKLHEKKKELEALAREIGKKRSQILDERKKLGREREEYEEELEATRRREQEAEQQQAFEESIKKAELSQVEPEEDPDEDPANRRASPRVAAAVDVTMNTAHNFYAGLTMNVSEGGLFIATYDDLPLGTKMDLNVSLPSGIQIRVAGKVVWVREYNKFTQDQPPGVGVQFLDLKEGDRAAIADFVRSRDPILFEAC